METYLNNVQLTAKILYVLSIDMDYSDYKETQKQDLNDIENALYYLKAIAQNDYNADYFRTFARCLDLVTELNNNFNEYIFNED